MEITGTLTKVLEEARGESARGPWVRGGFVIETVNDTYPRMVAFTCFGEERIAMIKGIAVGTQVTVTFAPESREFQGRYYTDLRCIRVVPFVAGQMPQQPAAQPAQQPAAAPQMPNFAQPPAGNNPLDPDGDLPF